MPTRKIVVYTQPDSLPCEAVKLFLKHRKAKFQERCVAYDEEALHELAEKYNSRSTPTVVIDDEVLIGFDPERLDQLLEP
jgi:glutaredoxin 3